ncbi:hypothetical protein SSS_10246 [Sarcoptes scabiei]|uniref:MOB kinase activator-like 2 n=1 Tax=Sarcoptes scabiei TaxID=52283 RepID=A0A834R8H0_SARSC|nr:hypothetical protein SSS_10246 [Sarcoptes scabiei]
MFVFNFVWKARRKDKDSSQSQQEETKQYLHSAMLECTTSESKLRDIVNLAEGLDYNEWLASHTIAFFEHINLLYGTISEFCSMSGCPDMSGPCNRQYLWIDEKGKRLKLTAPQYIDYVMTYAQKAINDESIFPTKFDKEFPVTFILIVKKIMRLLYHVVAHIYHSHFKEIVLLNLHPHLNCIFAHLVLFNDRFKLIDEKEVEVLNDLAIALQVYPPTKPLSSPSRSPHNFDDQTKSTDNFPTRNINIFDRIGSENTVEDEVMNESENYSIIKSDHSKSFQTFAVNELNDATLLQNEYDACDSNAEAIEEDTMNDQKENQVARNMDYSPYDPNNDSQMLIDDDSKHLYYQVSSPEPMTIEPMMSSENTPKKCSFDMRNNLRERSTSANAVLASSRPLEAFPIAPMTRRSNSDRTSVKSQSIQLFCGSEEQQRSMQHRHYCLSQSNFEKPETCP